MSQSQATYIESHVLRRFNIIKKVGSGAYGHVWKVQQKTTKKIFALKKIFDAFQHATDAQRTYRQIQILKQTDHPNIIKLFDTIKADNNKDVYLVFQFMEADLHNVISEDILKDVHIRFIIYQLTKALKYLHTGYIIHRDLKPSNILVNSNCSIKLCDFGLVRSISSKNDNNPILTQGVATRWYRAPEVLLGSKCYSTPADIWSFGCIIFQILAQKPLFAGNSTLDQIQKICSFTGYPSEQDIKSIQSQVSKSMMKEIKLHGQSQSATILKDIPVAFRDLIQKMIVFNPKKRITIQQILNHQVVKAFHKPEQEVSCNKQITTSVDDNKKFTVEQYRKLIYNGASNASRVGQSSANTILKSNSAKYIKKPSQLVQNQLSKTLGQKQKYELSKKFSYDNLKTLNKSTEMKANSLHNNNNNSDSTKKPEKQTLKYVRSAKDFLKTNNGELSKTLYQKKLIQNHQNKSTSNLSNHNVQMKEQFNRNSLNSSMENKSSLIENKSSMENKSSISSNIKATTYVNKTFYSPKNYLQPTKSSSNHLTGSSGWMGTKAFLNKEVKDKAYLFKSQKYISNLNKGVQIEKVESNVQN